MDMTQDQSGAGAPRTSIGGTSLEDLRAQYHGHLFEEFVPFFHKYGIDHELGGFTCALDHDGTLLSTNKGVRMQGRGLWVYSYLYEHFGSEEHLEVARKTRDFLVRHGRDQDGNWVVGLDREGNALGGADIRGYEVLFVAEGLQAYARACGDQESMDLAIEALWQAMRRFDDPDTPVNEGYIPISYPGMRTLGSHMVAILTLTQMLEQISDPELEALADRVVDGILNRFWNPEYGLMNEALDHDYGRPDDENEDFIYLGHGMETLWMMLKEAMRRKDREMFDLVADRFRRHIEVAWDDVYGGVFRGVNVNGSFIFDKVLWAQEEVLIGCLILLEHTNLDWPDHWFGKMMQYVEEKYSLKPHGYPMYIMGGDRKVTFRPHVSRKGNYHRPRHLMHNLLALDRIIARDGKVSDFWS